MKLSPIMQLLRGDRGDHRSCFGALDLRTFEDARKNSVFVTAKKKKKSISYSVNLA